VLSIYEGGYNSSAQCLSPLAQSVAYHVAAMKSTGEQQLGFETNFNNIQTQINENEIINKLRGKRFDALGVY